MTQLSSSVVSSLSFATSLESYLPKKVITFIDYTCKVYKFWKDFRRTSEMYTNTTNFELAMIGRAINYCCGRSKLVTVPSRILLTARIIIECVEAQKNLIYSYKKLKSALSNRPSKEPPHYISFEQWKFLPPSTRDSYSLFCNQHIERMRKIFHYCIRFLVDIFQLSMCYMNFIASFSLSKEKTEEAVQDCLLNYTAFSNKFEKYKEEFRSILDKLGKKYCIRPITKTAYGCLYLISSISQVKKFICKLFKELGHAFNKQTCARPPKARIPTYHPSHLYDKDHLAKMPKRITK